MPNPRANELLGYPPDARLLILNADDFGMYHAVTEGILRTISEGVVRSTSVMVPCPWGRHALRLLKEHPEIAFGVHLTVVSDFADYGWGPLTPRDRVPSLVDESGFFPRDEPSQAYLAGMELNELEVEFRAQIEAVLAAHLRPTHLDWHSLRIAARPDIAEVMLRLAQEYGLALRVYGQAVIEKVQGQGLPTNDYDFLDSSMLETVGKSARFAQLLRELPAGLSEWAVHPGLDSAELRAIEPDGSHFRQADLDFLVSAEAPAIIQQEGIILLNYAPLQMVWQGR